MFGFIENMFIAMSALTVTAYDHTKCVSLNNQQYVIEPKVINLHLNEYSQGLLYYQFAVDLDKCVGSCNTFNDLSNIVCVPN